MLKLIIMAAVLYLAGARGIEFYIILLWVFLGYKFFSYCLHPGTMKGLKQIFLKFVCKRKGHIPIETINKEVLMACGFNVSGRLGVGILADASTSSKHYICDIKTTTCSRCGVRLDREIFNVRPPQNRENN